MPKALKIDIGTLFGDLVILREIDRGMRGGQSARRFLCRCTCGNTKDFYLADLRIGDTVTCGCRPANLKHGQARDYARSKEYMAWRAMKARCLNQNHSHFKYYGGAGVTICPEWTQDFIAFLNHIGPMPSPGLTVDRIDGTKDYQPGNIKWSTRREQVRNRRNNVYVDFGGQRVLARDIALQHGIWPQVLLRRIRRGQPVAEAVQELSKC